MRIFLFAIIGIYAISASVFNWDWFWEHRKTQLFVGLFGRTNARIIYGVIGLIFLILGIGLGFAYYLGFI